MNFEIDTCALAPSVVKCVYSPLHKGNFSHGDAEKSRREIRFYPRLSVFISGSQGFYTLLNL